MILDCKESLLKDLRVEKLISMINELYQSENNYHLKSIEKIVFNEESPNDRIMGYYLPEEKIIGLNWDKLNYENYNYIVYVFLHELGHHYYETEVGISKLYNSKSKNKAYYEEEIKADKFSLKILKGILDVKEYLLIWLDSKIARYKDILNRMKDGYKFTGVSSDYTFEYKWNDRTRNFNRNSRFHNRNSNVSYSHYSMNIVANKNIFRINY